MRFRKKYSNILMPCKNNWTKDGWNERHDMCHYYTKAEGKEVHGGNEVMKASYW